MAATVSLEEYKAFYCLSIPTSLTQQHWFNQYLEFGAGLSVYPNTWRQRECSESYFSISIWWHWWHIFWSSSCHLVTVVLKLTVRWYWDNSSWESNSTNGCNISQVTITLAELRTVSDLDMSTLQINNVWAADIIDLSQGSDIYHFW